MNAFSMSCCFLVLSLAFASAATEAQATGRTAELLVGLSNFAPSAAQSVLVQIDARGRAGFTTSLGSPWPYWSHDLGMATDVDNATVLVPVFLDAQETRVGIARWDPVGRAALGTPWSGSASSLSLVRWSSWTLDSDGDLVPDALTLARIAGLLPELAGNVGFLGPTGRAAATLDLRALRPAPNGIVLNLCGVVLDPGAPSGVTWVSDPWALVVDVLP